MRESVGEGNVGPVSRVRAASDQSQGVQSNYGNEWQIKGKEEDVESRGHECSG